MNLVLFVTQANLPTLPEMVRQMAASQQTIVNGALIVVHDAALRQHHLSFALPLATCFKVSATLPAQVNGSHAEHEQIAAMFSHFLTTAYSRYPGPWLLFDEPALPKGDDWMQAALRQHGTYGSRMTGRAITNPGAARPVGPITLELDFQTLKFLRFPTRQNWRERGQFLFARHGFQLVPVDEWLFTLEKVEARLDESKPELRFILDEGQRKKPEEVCLGNPNPEYFTPPVEALTDDELRDTIRIATGKTPHHFTGRDKLLSMARELTTAPA